MASTSTAESQTIQLTSCITNSSFPISQARAFNLNNFRLTNILASVPSDCTLVNPKLDTDLEKKVQRFSKRRYLQRVLGVRIFKCKTDSETCSINERLGERWIRAYHDLVKNDWERTKFLATGAIRDGLEIDEIIGLYSS